LEVLYPVVPLAQRQALGIAVMSYDGHLGFGLLGDYDALPDLDGIALDLRSAVASLARAAGVRPPSAKAGRARGGRKAKPASHNGTTAAAKHAAGSSGSAKKPAST
jgi:hypothetical protein